jgi:hypothetical protein
MSTVPLVRAALKELRQATFDPADVVVEFGPRERGYTAGARLRIGRVTGRSDPEALGPRRSMAEEYDVECVLSYTRNTTVDQQEAVATQVMDWFNVAEYAIRASPSQTLDVPGVLWVVVMGDFELTDTPASETGGPINASYLFNVHVRAMYALTT